MADEASESLAAARRVDAICDKFEQALVADQSPQIEAILLELPEQDRLALLVELVGLEVDFRIARGEQPAVDEYLTRFPELAAEQIATFCRAAPNRDAVLPTSDAAPSDFEQLTVIAPSGTTEDTPATLNESSQRVRYFGDYELIREIARGGMGVVYEARQRSLNRPVALKMILSGQLASSEEVTRFHREAEAAAQLEHPGIVPIYEIGTDGDQHYFTMGYVAGPSLSARLLERPLEPREAASLMRDVAIAVHYAHEHGVIHRDLKPGNILLAPRVDSGSAVAQAARLRSGSKDAKPSRQEHVDEPAARRETTASGNTDYSPRITDFGLAKVSHADHSLTETGQILGTPSYMPPEQASGITELIGPAADIYSLGAVLYACLTGRPPFQSASVLDTVRQVLERDPVSLRDLNAAIPQDLETICLKCLEKSIPRRYSTAKEVADELQRFLDGHPILARPVSRAERFRRWCRRNPLVASLSAGVLLSLLLGIAVSSYFAWQENQRAISESNARHEEARQRREADRQSGIAKRLAVENLKLADNEKAARQQADRNADAAIEQTKLAKRNLYAAQMNLIQAAWDTNRLGEAVRILNLSRPANGLLGNPDDLRSFEWHLWDRRCNADLLTLKVFNGIKAGQLGQVQSVAFSPDGKRLVSGSIGTTAVKVWDISKRQEVLSLEGHHGTLSRLIQPDEKIQAMFEAHREKTTITVINKATFSPDGRRLASASGDGTIKLWNADTGEDLLTLKGHTSPVSSVAFSPDSQKLVSTASEEFRAEVNWELKVWDAVTGKETRSLSGIGEYVLSAVFSPDGKRIASSSSSSSRNDYATARIWDAETGKELSVIGGNSGTTLEVTFSPDGQRLATANGDGTVRVWSIDNGHEVLTLRGHSDHVTSVAFNAAGDRIASASADRTIKVWRADSGQELLTHKGHWERINRVVFSPDGNVLASASTDGTLKLWDAKTNHDWRNLSGNYASPALSGDGKFVASTDGNHTINIRDLSSGEGRHTFTLQARNGADSRLCRVANLALTHDARQLAVASTDSTIRLFDVATRRESHRLIGHTNEVRSVAFSPNGKFLVSGGSDATVRVWDVDSGSELRTLKGHTGGVSCVAFSRDGKHFASAGSDKNVLIWDVGTGRLLRALKGHGGIIPSVSFGPDGNRIVSGCFDRTVKVWDVTSGKELLTLMGHPSYVTQVTFSPDGQRVVSSGRTENGPDLVKVWDAVTGQELLTFNEKSLIGFSSDGSRLYLKHGMNYGGGIVADISPRPMSPPQELNADSSKLASVDAPPAIPNVPPLPSDNQSAPTAVVRTTPPVKAAAPEVLLQGLAFVRQKTLDGDNHRKQRDYAQAIACYQEVVKQEPNNLQIANRLAWLMAVSPTKEQKAAEVLELAQRVSQKDPNDFNYRNTLGAALYRADQFKEALQDLNEADQISPPNFLWRAHNQLLQAMCHFKLKDAPNSAAAYDKALDLLKQVKPDSHQQHEAQLLQVEFESLRKSSSAKQ